MINLSTESDEYRLAVLLYSMGNGARRILLTLSFNDEAESVEPLTVIKKREEF